MVACCFRFGRFLEALIDVLDGATLERELELQGVEMAVGAADTEDDVVELQVGLYRWGELCDRERERGDFHGRLRRLGGFRQFYGVLLHGRYDISYVIGYL